MRQSYVCADTVVPHVASETTNRQAGFHRYRQLFCGRAAYCKRSITCVVVLPPLQGQGRAVTCLDVDASGSRVVTGSLDYTIRMFDFGGMKNDLKSFR